jgi:hypothetical protein
MNKKGMWFVFEVTLYFIWFLVACIWAVVMSENKSDCVLLLILANSIYSTLLTIRIYVENKVRE